MKFVVLALLSTSVSMAQTLTLPPTPPPPVKQNVPRVVAAQKPASEPAPVKPEPAPVKTEPAPVQPVAPPPVTPGEEPPPVETAPAQTPPAQPSTAQGQTPEQSQPPSAQTAQKPESVVDQARPLPPVPQIPLPGESVQQTQPTQLTLDQPTPVPYETESADNEILMNEYQRVKFTELYKSALLRKALSRLGISFRSAEVREPNPNENYQEYLWNNFGRLIYSAYNEAGRSVDELDGAGMAIASRITLDSGYPIACVTQIVRREVDPDFVWIRSRPCEPKWRNQQTWDEAKRAEFTVFYDTRTGQIERTSSVGYGVDSFKSRRPGR